jgi:hypothetical protein
MPIPVGNKAKGQDFFDRVREREDIWSLLVTTHIQFSGPRRLGKTSILEQLVQEALARGWHAKLITVEDIDTVPDFIARIDGAFPATGLNAWVAKARAATGATANRIKKIEAKGPGGIGGGIELQAPPLTTWSGSANHLQLRLSVAPLLILVDEFSVFLDKLFKRDASEAQRLLGWLRTWRMASDVQCRFVFSGSIGLNQLLHHHGCSTYLNDCYDLRPGPFKKQAALDMLSQLARRENRAVTPVVLQQICSRVGWLSPYYLNLLLLETTRAARDREDESAGTTLTPLNTLLPSDVDDAYDRLLSTRSRFIHWFKRLQDNLSPADFAFACRLLSSVAQSPEGLTRRQLLSRLQKLEPNPDARKARLVQILWQLEEDGYINANEERITFLSFLLRDYWKRDHGQ